MSEDQSMTLSWAALLLVLLIAGLVARRPSIGSLVRSVVSWVAIFAIGYVVVMHRYEIGALFTQASQRLGLHDQQVSGETVRIRMSPDGHFWAQVSLNGVQRRMLIDSGATITAISEDTAAAAGVSTSGGGFPVMIQTANGTVAARRATVAEVSVGPLRTDDLTVVVAPSFANLDVLGMNFLSRLGSWRVERNTLVLEPDGDAPANPDAAADDTASLPARPRGREATEATDTLPLQRHPDFT